MHEHNKHRVIKDIREHSAKSIIILEKVDHS